MDNVQRGDLVRLDAKWFASVPGLGLHGPGSARTHVGQQQRRRHVLGTGRLTRLLLLLLLDLMLRTGMLDLQVVLVVVLRDGLVVVLQDLRVVLRDMD